MDILDCTNKIHDLTQRADSFLYEHDLRELTPIQISILFLLSVKVCRVKDIRLKFSHKNLSYQVHVLAQLKYIDLNKNREDGRATWIKVLPKGFDLLQKIRTHYGDALSQE